MLVHSIVLYNTRVLQLTVRRGYFFRCEIDEEVLFVCFLSVFRVLGIIPIDTIDCSNALWCGRCSSLGSLYRLVRTLGLCSAIAQVWLKGVARTVAQAQARVQVRVSLR